MPHAFIIGGTGQIGISTAAELLRSGWTVTCSHTGRREPQKVPPGASLAVLQRQDTATLADVMGTVDLLVDTMAFAGRDADQLAGLSGQFGQLCVISTASVYADGEGRSIDTAGTTGFPEFGGPIPETQALVPAGPQSYSTAKVELEQRLRELIMRPLMILRPCAIHGINSKHPREWWFVKRMLDGRNVIPIVHGGSTFHTSAAANIAALISTVAGMPGTHILNAGDPSPPTVRGIGEALAARLGWSGTFVDMPPDSEVGSTPWSAPSSMIVGMEAAAALGYQPAGSYSETLPPYVSWMQANAADWRTTFPVFSHYGSDPFDYAAEDAALS
ncbi:MAG TPA: reductase [Devosia sp.]|jgi:nucleoside-diphosphate-sugar epimerase|nr:reductase [Devosia sp.]